MATRRYKAFISYSHRDMRLANWLHGRLENFRLPEGIDAPGLGSGLRPIFKDRDELPASEDLGAALEEAIVNSDALIVLCSPHAAISPWIAKEIDLFKRVNGDARVFPAVVDGDPPYNMPSPLLVHYEDGTPTDELAEPIAADLRPEGDGRKLGVQKLVAGLVGVGLDELVDRQSHQRHRRLAIAATVSFVGMLLAIGLALYALQQRDTARAERAEANGLIEYMLTDLREELEPVGRLDLLDSVGSRAMDYYASQDVDDLSSEELARRARAVQLVAEMHNLRGDNDRALPAFRQAARTTGELLARNPGDPDTLFAHGQSLYWVGYIAWQRGEMAEARKSLEGYADISTRLVKIDPDNLDWQMEEAYALSNLGTMSAGEGRYDEALPLFRRSVEIVRQVAEEEGRPAARLIELGEGLSWVAMAQNRLGKFGESAATLEQEIALYDAVLDKDPTNNDALRPRMLADANLGDQLAMIGRPREARRALDRAVDAAENLLQTDPDHTWTLEMARAALSARAGLNWAERRDEDARSDYERSELLLANLRARDPKNVQWNVDLQAEHELFCALGGVDALKPSELAGRARSWIARLDPENAGHAALVAMSHFINAVAQQRMGNRADAAAAYARVIAAENKSAGIDVNLIALRAVAAERLGQVALAQELRGRLQDRKIDPLIDNRIIGG